MDTVLWVFVAIVIYLLLTVVLSFFCLKKFCKNLFGSGVEADAPAIDRVNEAR